MPPSTPEPDPQQQLFSTNPYEAEMAARQRMSSQQTPNAGTSTLPEGDWQAWSKSINDASLAMQAISRMIADQNKMLRAQNQIRNEANAVQNEGAKLEKNRLQTQKQISDLQERELAKRLKRLELTKEEDKIVTRMRKGEVTKDDPTIQRLTRAAVAQQRLDQSGLNVDQAVNAGVLTPEEATVLQGGPERAQRKYSFTTPQWMGKRFLGNRSFRGIPMSEGLAGTARLAMANPLVDAFLVASALGQGVENFQEQGAAGFVAGIPVIGGTLANMLNQIPGMQAVTAFGNTTRLGQVTGDGYGAGLSARFRAMGMGANPFDILSSQTASEIIAAARNQGFRGSQERAYESAMVAGYKQTGLDPQQMAALGEVFARNNGLDQFRATMLNIDNIARNSSQSVASVADQIQNLSQQLAGSGAAPLGLAGAIVQAVSTVAPHLTAAQTQQVGQFFGQAGLSMYSGFQGVAATTGIARRIAGQNQRFMLEAWRQEMAGMPQDQQDLFLANIINSGALPGVTDIKAARQLIMHGNDIVGRIPYNMGLNAFRSASSAFGSWSHRMLDEHRVYNPRYRLPRQPGQMTLNQWEMGSRRAYIRSLTEHLHQGNLSQAQINKIVAPLRHGIGGEHWHEAADRAQALMKQYTIQNNKRATQGVEIGLTPEARRFFSAKNVQKNLQLDQARQGNATYQGTDRSGN